MNYRCLFCLARGFEKLLERHIDDHDEKIRLSKQFFNLLARADTDKPTPYVARDFHALIRESLDNPDPYKEQKRKGNQLALSLYPDLKEKVEQAEDPFTRALRYAIAGNIMDYGPASQFDLEETIGQVEQARFAIDHSGELKERIARAKDILYIGDNAGEIVMDRLMIETMGHPNVTFAVRGYPVINDATRDDALEAGIDRVATVIDNGYDAPSTILDASGEEFMRAYLKADLIIAKGQGNFEGLMDNRDHRLWFLLMVKCQVIGDMLDVQKGDFVVSNNHHTARE